jgi:hypothetical protein
MIKSIKINDEVELNLSNSIAWAVEYREQFGHDIVPDILPVVSAIASFLGEASIKEFDIKAIDKDILQEALINLSGVQFVDFLNLVWAMNKAADGDKVALPKVWARQFENGFYLDIVAPEVFKLLLEGLVSSKNLQGLQRMTEAPTK